MARIRNSIGLTLAALAALTLAGTVSRLDPRGYRLHAEAAQPSPPVHSVTLHWKATPGAGFYYVYRSPVSGSQYQKIGTSPEPMFKDTPVKSGAVFYYVVTAVVDGSESKYSNEIKAVVP